MKYESVCPNMNHSRPNAPIKHCPNCGKIVGSQVQSKCTAEKHAARRKDRDHFCVDCGKDLKNL